MHPLFASQPPPDLPPHLRWRCVKLKPGTHGPYMLAGDAVGLTTHYVAKRTLPCLSKLPGCTMTCPYCTKAQRYTVYVPLWSLADVKQPQHVVQGAKRTLQTVTGFAFGDVLTVVRGNRDRDTALFTKGSPGGATTDQEKWRKKGPQDITRYLLHLWQWRELSEHFKQVYYPSGRSLEIEAGVRSLADDPPRSAEDE